MKRLGTFAQKLPHDSDTEALLGVSLIEGGWHGCVARGTGVGGSVCRRVSSNENTVEAKKIPLRQKQMVPLFIFVFAL